MLPGFGDLGDDLASNSELFDLVWRDDLTKLYNRRFFARYMKQVADWSEGAPICSLAMMDMDNLKRINDRLGHMAGDASLKRIGTIMNELAGEGRYAVRYAGDEFALILPETSREDAIELSNRLREAVVKDAFEEANLPEGLRPSLSIGVAQFPIDAAAGGDDLTEAADRALYVSKRTGKNKVTSAADVDSESAAIADIEALSGFPSRTLVGRDEPFRRVDEAFSLVGDGKAAFVLVEGEAGVGKTRLLTEVAKYAKEREVLPLIERCAVVNREEPYKAISGLLEGYLKPRQELLEQIARALGPRQRRAVREVVPSLPEDLSEPEAEEVIVAPPASPPGPPPPRSRRPPPRPPRPGGPRPTGRLALPNRPRRPPPPGRPGPPNPGGRRRPPPPRGRRPPPPGPQARRPARPPRRPEDGERRPPPPPPPRREERGSTPRPPEGRPKPPPPPRREPSARGEAELLRRSDSDPGILLGAPPARRRDEPSGSDSGKRRAAEAGPTDTSKRRQAGSDDADPTDTTVALFTGLTKLLRELSQARPVALFLDDIDAADEPTLELIVHLLNLQDVRLLVFGTARTQTREVDEEAPFHAFRKHLSELSNQWLIELGPLEREGTVELATHLLEGFRPPSALADQLFAFTRGNPLFVEGILKNLINTDKLRRVDDGWEVAEDLPSEMPVSVEELIRQQLKVIDPELAQLLADAAVVGPNFEFNVLSAAGGTERSEGETLDLVSSAVRAKLIRETGAGPGQADFEFTSRQVAETTYESLDPDTRAQTHRRVAGAIGEGAGRDAALAYHFGRAGDLAKRDRFLTKVRERQELLFDRDAIETLLSESGNKIPEVLDEPPAGLAELLPDIAHALATAAKVVRLYPPTSRVVGEALETLIKALRPAHKLAERFTVGHRGNAFVLNGRAIDRAHGTGQYQEAVVGMYRINSIKSLTFVKTAAMKELLVFLSECAKHSVQVPLEKYYWRVFTSEHGIEHLGITQKTFVLKRKTTRRWMKAKGASQAVAEEDLPLVKDVVRHFMAALEGIKKYPANSRVPAEALAALDRTLRQLFEGVPALALHEGEEDSLVINGTSFGVRTLSTGGAELLRLLRDCRLHGLVILQEISAKELRRFMERLAEITPKSFGEGRDPVRKLSSDGSFPNVLVGDALFQLAHDLISAPSHVPLGTEGGEDVPAEPVDEEKLVEELLPEPEPARAAQLPEGFQWPSDKVAQRARELCKLAPADLLSDAGQEEFTETCEVLLLEGPAEIARLLMDRMTLNFASQDAGERQVAAGFFLDFARRGSQELRANFFQLAVRRLSDALQIETDYDAFEKLADCAKIGILDRVADGDWRTAARLVRSLGVRSGGRVEERRQLLAIAQRVMGQVVADPRCERVFETIEAGSQQERRRAARVLENMGVVAVDALVRALMATTRSRVETFLTDMLAALAPHSGEALKKEVTPTSPSGPTERLLRAAPVVCQDPGAVLAAALQNPDQRVQTEALNVAQKTGGRIAQELLRWAMSHGSPQVQLTAVRHLGQLARADNVNDLLELLQTTNLVEVQRECCLAFGKLALKRSHHEKVVPILSSLLRAGGFLRQEYHQDVRHAAAWALGHMKLSEGARKALEKAQADKDKRVALTARLALEGKSF